MIKNLEYTLTKKDVYYFYLREISQKGFKKLFFKTHFWHILSYVSFGVGIMYAKLYKNIIKLLELNSTNDYITILLPLILIILISAVTYIIMYKTFPNNQVKEHEESIIKIVINDEDDRLLTETEGIETNYEWEKVDNIIDDFHNILIFLKTDECIIIPKRIFYDDRESYDTIELLKKCIDKYKNV